MNHVPALSNARLWRRLAAAAYDLLVVVALLMLVTAAVIGARRGVGIEPGSAWFQALLLAAWWLYFALSWTRGGQTVGMRAWRLVVTDRNGDAIGIGRSSFRFVAAAVSTLAAGLGFFWAVVDRDGLTWHDRASGTRLRLRRASSQPRQGQAGYDQ